MKRSQRDVYTFVEAKEMTKPQEFSEEEQALWLTSIAQIDAQLFNARQPINYINLIMGTDTLNK